MGENRNLRTKVEVFTSISNQIILYVPSPQSLFRRPFLGAPTHLYNWLCPLVGRSVGRSVTHSFDDPHGAPYWPTWPCSLAAPNDKVDL